VLVNDSYANIKEIVERNHFAPITAILVDIGYSSWQIEEAKRGFSFQNNETLDMRYNHQHDLTAEKIVNEYSEEDIKKILEVYGEEKYARQIAKKIVEERKKKHLKTTGELKNIIESVIPKKFQHGKIHCATRSFQAIRIAVNHELSNLEHFLPQALSVLASGGRLAVISFHSLEDRIVKRFFQEQVKQGTITLVTKKPITASLEEVEQNPRARSAKLRVIIKN
jgi:16S rRNA (cytosine1402-N4)-methyltransferase